MEENNYYDEHEIDLMEYLYLLWNNKFFIGGLVILAIISAFLFSTLIISPQYESEASIYTVDFELINGNQFNREDYLTFFRRSNILEQIINEFSLKENNPNYSNKNLSNKLSVSTNNNIVNLKLTDSDSARAAELLNQWINLFQVEVKEYIGDENQNHLNNLEEVLKSRKEELDELQTQMKNFREESSFELLKQRLETNRNILSGNVEDNSGIENQIETLKTDIEGYNSMFEKIRQQIESTNEFITEESYISADQIRVLRELLPENKNLDNLTITKETANTIYKNLKEKENEISQNLASSKARLSTLRNRRNDLESRVDNLEGEVAILENEFENLSMALETARNNYINIKSEYNEAQQSLNLKNYNINVMNEAYEQENSVSPNTRLNIAIAGILGLMLAIFIVFLKEFIKNADLSQYE